ncbi:hypothetical protein [Rahnella victoriana]|uniref:hypothetical protein n=1 Tax=Rahnella victoriana TaxID=1510570 RepID=UPI000F4D73CE|nr:hypothetical protein [Rahnella victoriana]
MSLKVDFSEHFTELMEGLSEREQEILGELTCHLEEKGFNALPGRNKQSNTFSPNFLGRKRTEAEKFAVEHKLWHYHVGYFRYSTLSRRGDWTSEFVVHYQNLSNTFIRFVHYSSHSPAFRNPTANCLV